MAGSFKPGDRVELHPATDLWMRGARFGTVTRDIADGVYLVSVDRAVYSARVRAEDLAMIEPIGGAVAPRTRTKKGWK